MHRKKCNRTLLFCLFFLSWFFCVITHDENYFYSTKSFESAFSSCLCVLCVFVVVLAEVVSFFM